eukprot:TRINITY_DN3008_c1_g1_i2.p3 TRINITY_DN3008_c1_g1~~TRINITY_DN3008_c1_g1_i2.p3  ORF type:complete len:103 (+),score=10.54 TRINITY_DN3008_c1_g1_i2:149-457(+)
MGSKIIRILKLSRGQVKETKGGGGCLKGYYIHLSLVNKISCDVLQQQQNKIGKKKLETLIVMIFFVCVCLLSFFFHDIISWLQGGMNFTYRFMFRLQIRLNL